MAKASFEAAIMLRQWDRCIHIVEQSSRRLPTSVFQFFTDATISSSAPSPVQSRLLAAIMAAQRDTPMPLRAKWYRVMYTLALDQPTDTVAATIDQICDAADTAALSETAYPTEELEWVVTTTFNRAVDAYCGSDERMFRTLGAAALRLAERMQDRGAMRGVLMERLARMSWEA